MSGPHNEKRDLNSRPYVKDPKNHRWAKRNTTRGLKIEQHDFIEWLVTPKTIREPVRQSDWAAVHGLASTTLTKWKKDADFRREWDRRLHDLHINPETVHEVLEAMHNAAISHKDVAAAKLWLEVSGVYKNTQVIEVDDKRSIKELSDEELDSLLQSEAVDELAERRAAAEE